ncbi:hypothetical protein [Tissierella sp. Yu-01]|uniref:hypothetical protein n=1 Tax=Tissierella sp. Yu-01 TaxID=3035694 RepID=UPI00240CFA8A|nr:hypothetical protein [Tissierella sp. Yu-01]WFA09101.1 hypothetical protein P3962_00600 [Tissierella sp. Yu-01]
MKLSKKTATICAFVLGVTILATSAFADIMLGSGYNSLKDSMKMTMAKLTSEVDNFSADVIISAKIDGKTFAESTSNLKLDIAKQSRETNETNLTNGEIREFYYYSDKKQNIYKNFEDGSYSIVEKRKINNDSSKIIDNPFEDEQAMDAEKILDAFVGSLENVIQVEESSGKKIYTGNLSESQVPPVVNAISSFAFKYGILDEWNADRLDVPYPKSNIYVIEASGKAIENEDGIIESGIFTASMSAQDSKGIEHIYSLDFSIDIKDINNTVVKAPNLDGQKVTYSKEGYEFDNKYIGKYKNDIVREEGNSFEKIGERFIEITSVKDGNVKGKYYEVYNEGYEADTVRSFEFYSDYDEAIHFTKINYTDNGEDKTGIIHRTGSQNINVSFNATINEDNGGYSYSSEDGFDNTFIRIFE